MIARFATLPMYDFPDVRAATNTWWAGIARHLVREGVRDVPPTLFRGDDLIAQWQDPALLVSQTCGYILSHDLAEHAQAIAAPCYSAPGCHGADYSSVILVREDHPGTEPADFRGSRAVYSRIYSHAGHNIFRRLIAPLAQGRAFFSSVSASGSHLDSIACLTSNSADIATIDCIIHAFVQRNRPELLVGTRSIGYTPTAPAPPYIGPIMSMETVERVRAALDSAIADPDLAGARADLLLIGFAEVDAKSALRIDAAEAEAIALGYPQLV
jgi:ABC-type phosphate/phosphonate transport system substrate-binding protein